MHDYRKNNQHIHLNAFECVFQNVLFLWTTSIKCKLILTPVVSVFKKLHLMHHSTLDLFDMISFCLLMLSMSHIFLDILALMLCFPLFSALLTCFSFVFLHFFLSAIQYLQMKWPLLDVQAGSLQSRQALKDARSPSPAHIVVSNIHESLHLQSSLFYSTAHENQNTSGIVGFYGILHSSPYPQLSIGLVTYKNCRPGLCFPKAS